MLDVPFFKKKDNLAINCNAYLSGCYTSSASAVVLKGTNTGFPLDSLIQISFLQVHYGVGFSSWPHWLDRDLSKWKKFHNYALSTPGTWANIISSNYRHYYVDIRQEVDTSFGYNGYMAKKLLRSAMVQFFIPGHIQILKFIVLQQQLLIWIIFI